MTQLQELRARVRSVLRDNGPNAFVGDDDIDGWLNEAQDDLALRLEIGEHTKTGTTSGATLALPVLSTDPVPVEFVSLDLGTEGDHVRIVDLNEWNQWVDDEGTPTDTIAYLYDAVITMYPTPTTGTAYTMRYRNLPTQMTAGDDEWQLPRQYERKALAYARYQACLKDERFGASDRYYGEYLEDLPSLPSYKDAKYPGPLRVYVAGNIFDQDSQARHLGRT